MPEFELRLLGPISVKLPAIGEVNLRGRTGELLACLAFNRGRAVPRASLAEWLWNDVSWEAGRRRLNTTLYRLRNQIEPDASAPRYVVSTTQDDLTFTDGLEGWLDVEEFEAAARDLGSADHLNSSELDRLESAVALYTGELCPSANGAWLIEPRARIANLALSARTRLAEERLRRDQPKQALEHALAALDIDHLREDIHRTVIRCKVALGDRAGAFRHFETLKWTLAEELDVDPMPETTRLVIDLSRGAPIEPVPADPAAMVDAASLLASLETARDSLLSLLHSIEVASDQLRSSQRDQRVIDA